MSFDPLAVTPLSHRVLVEASPLLPAGEFFSGYTPPETTYFSPLEVPAYVRHRLMAFLKGHYAIPPAFLESVLPKDSIPEARHLYRECLDSGMEEGEALMTLGLLARPKAPTAAPLSVARVIRSACDCVKETHVVISSSAGEVISDSIRLIRCSEAFAATEARTLESVKAEQAACDTRRRAAFARSRGFKVA